MFSILELLNIQNGRWHVFFVTLCISVIFYLPHAIWRVPVGELPTRYIAIYFCWHSWWWRLLMTMTQLFEKLQQQNLVLFIMVASRKSNFFRTYWSVFNEMEAMLVYQANPGAVGVELLLCQRFLLFQYICIDAGYVRSIPWSKSSAKLSFKVE